MQPEDVTLRLLNLNGQICEWYSAAESRSENFTQDTKSRQT